MTDDTTEQARLLRQNQTEAEKKLWAQLRNRQLGNYKIRRQHPIPPYIVDFFCEDKNFIIELDGGQHSLEADKKRSDYLENQGYKIIRFWNNDVFKNIEGILQMIEDELSEDPSPQPSPEGRGSTDRICMGKITTAHGIRGLVKLQLETDTPKILEGQPLYTSATGAHSLRLTIKNQMGKFWLGAVDGIDDRNASELLRGTELWMDRGKLPDIDDEDEFYISDLLDLQVQDTHGKALGTVIAVENFGASDLLEIRPKVGPTFYIPFTNETVPEVDLEKGVITIFVIEGLLES